MSIKSFIRIIALILVIVKCDICFSNIQTNCDSLQAEMTQKANIFEQRVIIFETQYNVTANCINGIVSDCVQAASALGVAAGLARAAIEPFIQQLLSGDPTNVIIHKAIINSLIVGLGGAFVSFVACVISHDGCQGELTQLQIVKTDLDESTGHMNTAINAWLACMNAQ